MQLSENNFLIVNLVFIITYFLIVSEKIPRVVAALLGASFLLVTKIITQEEALNVIDFNVIFLLVGMMILINVLKHTGFIKYAAVSIAKQVDGNGVLLLIYFSILTAILSAYFDNISIIILIASVTLTITQELNLNPIPFLISEIIASNLGGTSTLIGDPPNVMIGSAANLSFNQFILNVFPIILIIFPVAIFTLYLFYKKELIISKEYKNKLNKIDTKDLITNKSLVRKSLLIVFFVLLGFIFHGPLKIEAGTVALAGASFLLIFESSKHLWDDVEWTTIFFFIGLFVIVGALEKVGTIDYLSEFLFQVTKGDFQILTIALLWFSAILSGLMDNIPYTATIIPVIEDLHDHFNNLNPLWWAVSLGTGLGANFTIIGAAANILVADLAKDSNQKISFIEFLKIGSIITIQTLLIASAYIYLRYLH